MDFTAYIITAVASYFLGSIPTGYLVAKAKGIDIRTTGSGNIGATNVFRIMGKPAGIFVLVTDALKGFLACKVLAFLTWSWFGESAGLTADNREYLQIVAGVCAILGHNYTCWLKFKGGKGIATSAGVLMAWVPIALAVCLAAWIVVFAVSRYVSLASMTAALALPFAVAYFYGSGVMTAIGAGVGGLAIYKHRANIQRLLNGTEHRFGRKKSPEAEQ